jgi:hypothetical protein
VRSPKIEENDEGEEGNGQKVQQSTSQKTVIF